MMRTRALPVSLALSVLLVAAPALAQDAALPPLDPQQSWRQAVGNLNAVSVSLIRYAREHGDDAREAGRFVGHVLGSAWNPPPDADRAVFFAEGIGRNFQSWPGTAPVVSRGDAGGVVVRYNRAYRDWFGNDAFAFGVSLADYEAFVEGVVGSIGERLGLETRITTTGGQATLSVLPGG
jgi:hypothetical protein